MKKLLLLIMFVTAFVGCEKEDSARTEQTIFVHLSDRDGSLITLKPENTAVFFFEDNGKAIDYSKSNPTLDKGKLTYTDGTLSLQAKIMDYGKPAIYTFENVPNGKYILWVHYYPYSFGIHSSKSLTVNEDSHLRIENKIFRQQDAGSYESW